MSFSRINYDDCAYDLQLNRSTAPGTYRLFFGSANHNKKCYQYNEPLNSREQVSMARDNCEPGFGKLADIESSITNRKNYLEKCNKNPKNDDYKDTKVTHKKLCSSMLESEDTRFTHPLDNYRGMSLTGYYYTPYLHVNPQSIIQTNHHREGNSTRQMVKDCYNLPKQTFWDKGKGFPPKVKEIPKPTCKICCN